MKVNKKFVEEVASGKYSDYDTHGEMQESARRILACKAVSKFSWFCRRMFGGELPDNVMDMYDAFVDFATNGADIRLDVPMEFVRKGFHQFFGMTPRESLEELWTTACCDDKFYDFMLSQNFRISGEKGLFLFNPWALHYYYDKGRLCFHEMLEFCRVA